MQDEEESLQNEDEYQKETDKYHQRQRSQLNANHNQAIPNKKSRQQNDYLRTNMEQQQMIENQLKMQSREEGNQDLIHLKYKLSQNEKDQLMMQQQDLAYQNENHEVNYDHENQDDQNLILAEEQQQNILQNEEYNDNYEIDKWEEVNKENEINELESLEFSVNREAQEQTTNNELSTGFNTNNCSQKNKRNSNLNYDSIFQQSSNIQTSYEIVQQTKPPIGNRNSTKKKKGIKDKEIQKLKEMLQYEEKYKGFSDLYNKETSASIRKKKDFIETSQDEECTFQPRIDPISKMIIQTSFVASREGSKSARVQPQTHEVLYQMAAMNKEKLRQKQVEAIKLKQEYEIQGCTFQPNLFNKNGTLGQSSRNDSLFRQLYQSNTEMSMYERNKKWEEEKKQRLHQERERKQEYELKDCFFTPNIRREIRDEDNGISPRITQASGLYNLDNGRILNKTILFGSSPNRKSPERRFIKQNTDQKSTSPLYSNRGVQEFLKRQEKIRENKKLQEEIERIGDGKLWQNKLTKPKGFMLYNYETHEREEFDASGSQKLSINTQNLIKNNKQKSSHQGSNGSSGMKSYQQRNSIGNNKRKYIQQDQSEPDIYIDHHVQFKDAVCKLRDALHQIKFDCD